MALMPIATMIIARFVLGEAMTALQSFGALFALAGMVVIVSRGAPASLLDARRQSRRVVDRGERHRLGLLHRVPGSGRASTYRVRRSWCCCSAPAR